MHAHQDFAKIEDEILSLIKKTFETYHNSLTSDEMRMYFNFLLEHYSHLHETHAFVMKHCGQTQECFNFNRLKKFCSVPTHVFPILSILAKDQFEHILQLGLNISDEYLAGLLGLPKSIKFLLTLKMPNQHYLMERIAPALIAKKIRHLPLKSTLECTLQELAKCENISARIIDFIFTNDYFNTCLKNNTLYTNQLEIVLANKCSLEKLNIIFSLDGATCHHKKDYSFAWQAKTPSGLLRFMQTIALFSPNPLGKIRLQEICNQELAMAYEGKQITAQEIIDTPIEQLQNFRLKNLRGKKTGLKA